MSEQTPWRGRTGPADPEPTPEDIGALVEERRAEAGRLGYDLDSPGLSEDTVARITEYARYSDAHPALRELQRDIDAGRYTWQDVAEGRVEKARPPEPEQAGPDSLRETWTRLRAGDTPEDILDEHAEADEQEQRWASPYNAYARGRRSSGGR